MKYDLDEIFNSIKQKYWWVLWLLCLSISCFSLLILNLFIGKDIGFLSEPSIFWAVGIVSLLCWFILYGFIINYTRNYIQDNDYKENEH